ncbi:MAG: FAD-dependent oxidoreductase [Propionibacteriales bacterium]|nr:FAD-dependent oxidoreductase [Propionibacteriales bacterium]
MSRPRVVIAGLGDTGLLVAIHLSKHADVVGISSKPGMLSGQELGQRLARPREWVRDYWVSFDRYRKLDRVRRVHGELLGVDLVAKDVTVRDAGGREQTEPYDVLVIATGVSNGFWRSPALQSVSEIEESLGATHDRLASSAKVVVIGGGAAAVSSALNIARTWPDKQVDLYFPGERALPQHHGKVWSAIGRQLTEAGVGLHPGHRAVVPDGFGCDEITAGDVAWSTGQEPVSADAVLWTIGRVRPNSSWLPDDVLDDGGFVKVDEHLRVVDPAGLPHVGVYAIGDIAATDPLRNSARSRADGMLAHNIRAGLDGRKLKSFTPSPRRWGSVVGVQDDKLEVFTPTGSSFKLPAWSRLQPLIVWRGIYKGVRRG